MSVALHALRSRLSSQLGWLTAKSDQKPSLAFATGVGAAAVIVVVLHWLQAAGLASGNAVLATLAVGISVILAAGCWALLLWLFWRTRLDPDQDGYTLAVVLSVVTICVGLEAFAGSTTFLWQRGVIRSAQSGTVSLWRAEGHYLWHLVNSVPLISAPQTLGWRDPWPFTSHASGALLLTFKIAIIVPLIRLGLSGYQIFESRRAQKGTDLERDTQRLTESGLQPDRRSWSSIWLPDAGDVWRFFVGMAVILIAAAVAFVVLFDPASSVNRWLSTRLRPGIGIGNIHFPLGWLDTAPQWLVVAAIIIAISFPVRHLGDSFASLDRVLRSIPAAIGAILLYFVLLALLTVTVAGTSLALLHVGGATASPEIPPGSQPQAALNVYTWAIADMLPGPSIPKTLNWSLQYRFVDHWSEALLLIYKIAFAAVLLFPVYRIFRTYAQRSRPPAAVRSVLPAARQFFDLLHVTQFVLDRLETFTSETVGARPTVWDSITTGLAADRAVKERLPAALRNLRSLFGDSNVTRSANAAAAAANNRLDAINDASSRFIPTKPVDLAEKRATLERRIAEFAQSANDALGDAVAVHSSLPMLDPGPANPDVAGGGRWHVNAPVSEASTKKPSRGKAALHRKTQPTSVSIAIRSQLTICKRSLRARLLDPVDSWSVAFSPCCPLLAVGERDRVQLWDVSDPATPASRVTLKARGHSLAFSPDGRLLATSARLWDVNNPAAPTRRATLPVVRDSLAFSPDGRLLATGAQLWDVSDPAAPVRRATLSSEAPGASVSSVAFSPDGRFLATAAGRDQIPSAQIWKISDPDAPVPWAAITGHTDRINSVAWSPNSLLLATGSADQTARLWDVSNPAAPMPQATLNAATRVSAVAFSSDARWLAVGCLLTPASGLTFRDSSNDGTSHLLWDITDPAAPEPQRGCTGRGSNSLAFSADDRLLAGGGIQNGLLFEIVRP